MIFKDLAVGDQFDFIVPAYLGQSDVLPGFFATCTKTGEDTYTYHRTDDDAEDRLVTATLASVDVTVYHVARAWVPVEMNPDRIEGY